MKIIHWTATVCCLISCSQLTPETKQSTSVVEDIRQVAADIPAGAIREVYEDNAAMEKVTIKDASGQGVFFYSI